MGTSKLLVRLRAAVDAACASGSTHADVIRRARLRSRGSRARRLISRSAMSRMLSGETEIKLGQAERLARAAGYELVLRPVRRRRPRA